MIPLSFLGSFGGAIEFMFEPRATQFITGGREVGGPDQIWEYAQTHIEISAVALAISLAIALPIGAVLGGKGETFAVSVGSSWRAVPELALIALAVRAVGVRLPRVAIGAGRPSRIPPI